MGYLFKLCTMLWDRTRDQFKLGQWLRGRIYERRCDLTADGRHFIYFAMNGKWGGPVKGSWTATLYRKGAEAVARATPTHGEANCQRAIPAVVG